MEKMEFEKLFKSTVKRNKDVRLHLISRFDESFITVDKIVPSSGNKFYIYLKGGCIGLINCETVFAIN